MAQTGLILNEKSTGYDPEKMTLDPATQTVQGQVQNIMKSDSPFVTQARTAANQGMNARGLLNSSMALGETEKAAYNAALPIASADAQAALTVAGRNQDAANASRQFGAQSENVMGQQELQGEQAMELETLRGENQKSLANIEAQYKQTMQSNDSAARFFSQTSASISDILKEPNIPKEQKDQLVQKQLQLLTNGLAVMGNIGNLKFTVDGKIVGLEGLLDFSTPVNSTSVSAAATPTSPAPSTHYEFDPHVPPPPGSDMTMEEWQRRVNEWGASNG